MAGEEITIPVALMHTGVAMGTVFIVLILISFVIYLLRFVPKLFDRKGKEISPEKQQKLDRGNDVSAVQKADPVRGTAPAKKIADAELVAVIAAAIAATMSEETGVPVSPDGLVIRSIKKRM
ncbi:MAG: OadG family protein [Eubacterium sp.]|nr:OadG family protein [Eubacterium sp.]